MTYLTEIFCDEMKKQLLLRNIEIVKIVPLPLEGSKDQKMKLLEDTLVGDDEAKASGVTEYVVQVRSKVQESASTTAESKQTKPNIDGIYLPNGKLNVPYLIRNADLLFDAGDYSLARRIYRVILQSGECSSSALYRIGRCYESEGKWEEARAKYEESIVFHPSLECYQKLASLLIRLKKHQQAAEILERAQALKESNNNEVAGAFLKRLPPRSAQRAALASGQGNSHGAVKKGMISNVKQH